MPPLRPRWKQLLIDSAIARMAIFVLLLVFFGFLHTLLLRDALGWSRMSPMAPQKIAADLLVRVVPPLLAYWLVVRFIELRRVQELDLRRLVPDNAIGFAGGALLIGAVMAILWAAGSYTAAPSGTDVQWLRPLLIHGVGTAIIEEVIFRGILFRILDEDWGLWPALIVSALFFGGVHIGNQNATWWTSFAIAVEAGVLLGVVYHVTRSLWTCIGLHMSWNFLQGTVFGSPVSGMAPASSWLSPQFSGPAWLTGGNFGIEGSVLTVALSLALSLALLAAGRRRPAHNVAIA